MPHKTQGATLFCHCVGTQHFSAKNSLPKVCEDKKKLYLCICYPENNLFALKKLIPIEDLERLPVKVVAFFVSVRDKKQKVCRKSVRKIRKQSSTEIWSSRRHRRRLLQFCPTVFLLIHHSSSVGRLPEGTVSSVGQPLVFYTIAVLDAKCIYAA